MADNLRRKAANEAVFREVNERITTLQHRFAQAEHEPLNIVCECDRLNCADQLSVPLETYEKVRGDATLFFVHPGHEDDTIEDVIDTGGNYIVVRKHAGTPQEIAEETDPRA